MIMYKVFVASFIVLRFHNCTALRIVTTPTLDEEKQLKKDEEHPLSDTLHREELSSCMYDAKPDLTYTHHGKFSNCPVQINQQTWEKNGWDGKVLVIHHGAGRFGNQLFYAAATFVVAAKLKRPVLVTSKAALGWGLGELPCLQSSPGLENALASGVCNDWSEEDLLKPNGIERSGCLAKMESQNLVVTWTEGGFQQKLSSWGNDPENFFPLFREIFNVQSIVADLAEKPGPNDLVLYFRTYHLGGSQLVNDWNGCQRLQSPPNEFFKRAIERHQNISIAHRNGRVWVLSAPDQRNHPTVQRLVREHNAVMYSGGDGLSMPWLYDFAFISAAKHIATSFSTFGWWATVVGNPIKVHFPIMPNVVPMPWCNLLPNGDQYILDDWWTGNAYSGSKTYKHALQLCQNYETDNVIRSQMDLLKAFYSELEQ